MVAHEFGHGVDDHTPGGISGGGTQEFVADTFGAATEWYANNPTDTPDFTVGEQVNLVGSGPIRYMYNPSLAGDANCYSSSIPTEEVHAAAGPGNHWFYLLAEGTSPTNGQPTSPTCNSSSVTGIGIQKAEQIMYNAMLMKTSIVVVPEVPHLDADRGQEPGRAAAPTFNAVKAAWNAVSVPAQTGDPTCTTGGNTVTVTNPGSPDRHRRHGEVAAADRAPTRPPARRCTWSATGLPGRPVDQRLDRPDQRHADHGRHLQRRRSTATRHAPARTGSTTFTWTIGGGGGGCSARARSSATPASRPVRPLRGPRRPAWSTARPASRPTRGTLEGLAGRLRHHPHRHAHRSR